MGIPNNLIALTSFNSLQALASALKILDIVFFSYTRLYCDGRSTHVLNDQKWYEMLLKRKKQICTNVYRLKSDVKFWVNSHCICNKTDLTKINFGIQFSYKYNNYIEVFSFAFKSDIAYTISKIIYNLDLLEKFIKNFQFKIKK